MRIVDEALVQPQTSAAFGFRPAFLPFNRTEVDETDFQCVKEVLASGNLSLGDKIDELEQEFAGRVGCQHAIAVQSNAAAIHLAMKACGLERGDEVITTPYAYASTAGMIRQIDAHPVFVDVDSRSLNMDVDLLDRAVSRRTRAIIPLHVAGLPADMERIHKIAQQYSIAVIEDASHAFPMPNPWSQAQCQSDAVCFSLLEASNHSCGFGGMICTDSDSIARRCRIAAGHGIGTDPQRRSWDYEIVTAGLHYGMSDVMAAVALSQLRKTERTWQRRREIAMTYNAAFSGIPELDVPVSLGSGHAWQIYMLRLNQRKLTVSRDEFVRSLHARNIGATVHFMPLHLHSYYKSLYAYQASDFPIASWEYEREVSLPIYSSMSDEDIQDVVNAVGDVIRQGTRV